MIVRGEQAVIVMPPQGTTELKPLCFGLLTAPSPLFPAHALGRKIQLCAA